MLFFLLPLPVSMLIASKRLVMPGEACSEAANWGCPPDEAELFIAVILLGESLIRCYYLGGVVGACGDLKAPSFVAFNAVCSRFFDYL